MEAQTHKAQLFESIQISLSYSQSPLTKVKPADYYTCRQV